MKVSVPDEVVFRDLRGEALIIHMGTGDYFGLDEIGTRIWKLLEQHRSVDAVVQLLLEEYDVVPKRLRRDVDTLVLQLVGKGLLVASDR